MLQFARPLLFSKIKRVSRPSDLDLSAQMESLSLKDKPHRALHAIQIRSFHTTCSLRRDKEHLTPDGFIKESYLKYRREFLLKHNLLNDKIIFRSHTVYENSHLFDIDEVDQNGISNLERTLKGLAPLTIGGEDFLTIHHFDQTHTGDWIVLPHKFHCQYDQELHSNITVKNHVIRHLFSAERIAYWQHVANHCLEHKIASRNNKKKL